MFSVEHAKCEAPVNPFEWRYPVNIWISRREIWAAVAAGTLSLREDAVNSPLIKEQTDGLRENLKAQPTSKGRVREGEPAKRLGRNIQG